MPPGAAGYVEGCHWLCQWMCVVSRVTLDRRECGG